MKLHAHLLAVLALSMLASCAPRPTLEPAEERPPENSLYYRTTPGGDLLITTVPPEPQMAEGVEYPPLVSGFADITGYGLEIKQGPYCVQKCVPNSNGYIGMRFKASERGNRIVVQVVDGEPVLGEARFDTGDGVSVLAVFEPPSSTQAGR